MFFNRFTIVVLRIAPPGDAIADPADRYTGRWYVQEADFDAGDRVVAQSTGAQTLELTGTSQESKVFISYTDRGTVKQVTSSFGILVDHVYRDADGVVTQIEYGDVAKTTTDFTYDNRRRVKTVQTHRGPPASWTTPSTNYLPAPTYSTDPTTSFQLILQDDEFSYDAVDNPVEIRDWRNPAEWPTSAKPVTRKMQYDDLNRVTQIEYQYPTATGKDLWKSPFTADFEAGNEDSRRAKPSPHQVFDNRPLVQSFDFDWLGNTTKIDDDAHGFYGRSLGKITNNSEENTPYQMVSAKVIFQHYYNSPTTRFPRDSRGNRGVRTVIPLTRGATIVLIECSEGGPWF